jgi:hypothetical protein
MGELGRPGGRALAGLAALDVALGPDGLHVVTESDVFLLDPDGPSGGSTSGGGSPSTNSGNSSSPY